MTLSKPDVRWFSVAVVLTTLGGCRSVLNPQGEDPGFEDNGGPPGVTDPGNNGAEPTPVPPNGPGEAPVDFPTFPPPGVVSGEGGGPNGAPGTGGMSSPSEPSDSGLGGAGPDAGTPMRDAAPESGAKLNEKLFEH